MRDDLYVFAINLDSGRFEAHDMNPKWAGTDARELRDVEGRALVQEMLAQVKRRGEGRVDYVWRNPVTNAVERKRSFVRQGQPIGAYGTLIAGCGLAQGLIVVTGNVGEFQRVSGLVVENWR